MTARELYDNLTRLLKMRDIENDTPVLITLSDSSVGGRAFCRVSCIHTGFDWEAGQLRIEPEEKIFKNIHRMDEPVGIIREECGDVSFNACGKCHMRIAKDDRYCRHCGQRLK